MQSWLSTSLLLLSAFGGRKTFVSMANQSELAFGEQSRIMT